MSGYQLSRQAAAAQRTWDRSRGGNVVPLRTVPAQAKSESREIGFEDVWGMSRDQFLRTGGIINTMSAATVPVTIDTAMTVPAFASGVNFIASTMASLPLNSYRKKRDDSRESLNSPVSRMLHDAVNETLTSFEWRRQIYTAKLTGGRGLTYIERAPSGRPLSLWPMDPNCTTIRRAGFRNVYDYREGNRVKTYDAMDVIDLPFMLRSNGYGHRSPLEIGKDVLGLAIAITKYGSRFFAGGGVPPFAIEGNFQTPAGMQRAADDLAAAVSKAATESRQALVMPTGHTIKSIGVDMEKAQLIETQRFCVEQIARLLSLPPIFLQDLTHGTYSNTEQQDTQLSKHLVLHHAEQLEQELYLKLFGVGSSSYAEFEMDGLQRGDFPTRMKGWAVGIAGGFVKPNEARKAENYPDAEGGDQLFMQGATVPIGQAGQQQAQPGAANPDDTIDPNGADA